MTTDCLFCKIVAGEEPSERIAAENGVVAFKDKFPSAPVHVLVVPEVHLDSAHQLTDEHAELLSGCFRLARRIADEHGIAEGYRIVTNVGSRGGQAISHLHFHVVGGKQLGSVD